MIVVLNVVLEHVYNVHIYYIELRVHAPYKYEVWLVCDWSARCMSRIYFKFARTLKPAKSQFTQFRDTRVPILTILLVSSENGAR
jgi:hypothetical protein